MKKQFILLTALIGSCLIGGISTANAVPTLRLTSGLGATTTVTDGNADGVVTFNGILDNWVVNVATGLTFPVPGFTPQNGHLDLNSVNVSSGAGTMTMEFSEVGFTSLAQAASWASKIGGTLSGTGGSLVYNVYADGGNVLFGHGTTLTTLSFNSPGVIGGTQSGSFGPAGTYSLTIEIVLTHTTTGNSSFDAETQKVPEGGSTVAMLGFALIGLGGVTLLRKKQQARV